MYLKVDLYVYSKYFDCLSEWILCCIGLLELFVEFEEVYCCVCVVGMDFVMILDYNCIVGVFEIVYFDGMFLLNEVIIYFLEDGCKIYCLVVGIIEEQFDFIE